MANKIAVLYFSDGPEAEASRLTAKDMLAVLPAAIDLPLSNHNWAETIARLPSDTFCLLATHGGIGENGTLQGYLESLNIPHSHSRSNVCAVLSDKHATKLVYRALSIPTPDWVCDGTLNSLRAKHLPYKLIHKPRFGGSKQGISRKISKELLQPDEESIYEESIDGDGEVSIVILRNGKEYISLAPIERRRSKEIGKLEFATGNVETTILDKCAAYALSLSLHLGTHGVVKTDFLIDSHDEIWAIETDAIPGLSKQNAAVVAAEKNGIDYNELLNIVTRR